MYIIIKEDPILLAKSDLTALIEKYKYLLLKIVNKYCTMESYRDDLMQAAYLGLMEAYHTFDSSKRSKFSSWLYFKVNWAVCKERNNYYLISCSPNTRPKRKEEYVGIEEIKTTIDPLNDLMQKEVFNEEYAYFNKILKKLHKKLSQDERDVFLKYYVKNHKVKEILLIHPNAYKVIARIKEKINKLLLLDGKRI